MKQLILLLTVAVLIGHSQAQGNQKCAANGEYCLTHSECCSGSCLSFSYKCVPVPPGASVGTIFVPAPIITDNRFGGPDDGGASITQKTCAKNGEYCLTHAECCSGSCLSFSYKCVPTQPPASGTSGIQQQPARPQQPTTGSSTVGTTIDLSNRVGEGDQSTVPITAGTTAPPRKCAALGEYCLTSSECCSGSCLSYSYKCVTNRQLQTSGGFLLPRPTPVNTVMNSGGFANRFDGTSDSSSSPPQKCAAVGEYCLTAADCCSRSCLSFSYKCVQNYNLGTQQLTSSGIPVQQPAINNIDTSNRFGTSDRQCLTNGHYCFHSKECCSGACFKSFCATQINLGVPESELTRPSAANGPFVQVNSLDELITRFGGGAPAPSRDSSASASLKRANIGARSGAEKHCAVVGEGCSRQEDCCSMRCHSYRRKCVT
ncbi:uncharacterized protein LOC135697471 isoform X1 [Ochlerotatus camptorhynchus]|uniref:uncharacterized protein LOC135697471 isoform X1 n=1 Tax=Ochlerotatus camptorhynchus TaxID=644619 RepID=UPI0031CEF84C